MNDYREPKNRRREKPNTLVVDPINGWGLDYIENPSGNLRRFGDYPVYYMSRIKDEIHPILRPTKINTLPEKLYRATHWPEVKELFKLDNSLLEKLKVGAMIGLVVILLFFIYLIIS